MSFIEVLQTIYLGHGLQSALMTDPPVSRLSIALTITRKVQT